MFRVNANLTETSMLALLEKAGCERVVVPTKYYFTLMANQKGEVKQLWEQRLKLAASHLNKMGYKASIRDDADGVLGTVDWERVPSNLFVDLVLGIDCLVQTEDGTILGVDCTTSTEPDVLNKKRDKLNKLKPLLQFLGIDAVVVTKVTFSEFGFSSLSDVKKRRLIKGMKKILNKDFTTKWIHTWTLDLTE